MSAAALARLTCICASSCRKSWLVAAKAEVDDIYAGEANVWLTLRHLSSREPQPLSPCILSENTKMLLNQALPLASSSVSVSDQATSPYPKRITSSMPLRFRWLEEQTLDCTVNLPLYANTTLANPEGHPKKSCLCYFCRAMGTSVKIPLAPESPSAEIRRASCALSSRPQSHQHA